MMCCHDSKDTCDVTPQSQHMADIIMMHIFLLRKEALRILLNTRLQARQLKEMAGEMKPYAVLHVGQCSQLWLHIGIIRRDLKICH